MKLYTFFFQYKEVTYVHQHKGQNIETALMAWGEIMQAEVVEDTDESFKKIISEEINDRLKKQGLTPREDLINVWCCTFLFDGDVLGDLNITTTDEGA